MGLKKLAICAGLIALSSPAMADSYWNHNGSVVRLVADGDYRAFYYHRPSPTVQRLGVGRGTLLFEGYRQGGRYYGTAYAFPRACGDGPGLAYEVAGDVLRNQTKVVLQGRRLVTCGSNQTKTDTLVFEYLYSD